MDTGQGRRGTMGTGDDPSRSRVRVGESSTGEEGGRRKGKASLPVEEGWVVALISLDESRDASATSDMIVQWRDIHDLLDQISDLWVRVQVQYLQSSFPPREGAKISMYPVPPLSIRLTWVKNGIHLALIGYNEGQLMNDGTFSLAIDELLIKKVDCWVEGRSGIGLKPGR